MHSHCNMISSLLNRKKYIATSQLESLIDKLMIEWRAAISQYAFNDFHIKPVVRGNECENLIYKIVLGIPEIYLNMVISKEAIDVIIRLFFGKRNNACHITKLENVAIVKAIEALVEVAQKAFSVLLNKEISATFQRVYENDIKKQFSFLLKSSDNTGLVSIAISEELSNMIKKQSTDHVVQKIQNIDAIKLDLCAMFAKREMSVVEIQALKVGQVINFYTDDVSVLVNGTKVCQGKIGSVGDGRAVKVERLMEVN